MSDERVSALEEALRDKASRPIVWADRKTAFVQKEIAVANAYKSAASLVRERDAQLWEFLDLLEELSHADALTSSLPKRLRAILEGKTNE